MTKTFKESKLSGLVVLMFLVVSSTVFVYWRTTADQVPGEYETRKGNYRLEDGQYDRAIKEFEEALATDPLNLGAHHGLGVTYVQMGRVEDALVEFNRVLEIDPDFAFAYADRGITYDRMGRYEEALRDYRRALELDPETGEGPGKLWRFMRNITEKPPTIRDRADYIEGELRKPPEERVLKVPEVDAEQRMYKK